MRSTQEGVALLWHVSVSCQARSVGADLVTRQVTVLMHAAQYCPLPVQSIDVLSALV